MFSSSTEYGEWLNGVWHPSIHSDHGCPMMVGSIVPISMVEAVESVWRNQPAAISSVHTCAEQAHPAHSWIDVPYPYAHAGSPDMILALLRQDHQLTSSGIITLNPPLATHFAWALLHLGSTARAFWFNCGVNSPSNQQLLTYH